MSCKHRTLWKTVKSRTSWLSTHIWVFNNGHASCRLYLTDKMSSNDCFCMCAPLAAPYIKTWAVGVKRLIFVLQKGSPDALSCCTYCKYVSISLVFLQRTQTSRCLHWFSASFNSWRMLVCSIHWLKGAYPGDGGRKRTKQPFPPIDSRGICNFCKQKRRCRRWG